jgi:hypothetical protein
MDLLVSITGINDIQARSIVEQIKRCKLAHYTNLKVRINGQFEEREADWVKNMHILEQKP